MAEIAGARGRVSAAVARLRTRLRAWQCRLGLRFRRRPPARRFDLDQVGAVHQTYYGTAAAREGPWEEFRDAHLTLPAWFQRGLDPWSDTYAAQQQRLWALIVDEIRAYSPEVHEQDRGWDAADPIRHPGFYARRGPEAVPAAGDQVIAIGMLLKFSGLEAGQWALEYGPGFGQAALALARLGVNIDTVDISARFCDFVRRQAEHFQLPLYAFHGAFGMAPRPGQHYQLIWFYESFHHCVDFVRVVPQLATLLADGGRVILAGEPIVEEENEAVPYPWGVRLHSEVVAVMRHHGWFELGFSEAFIFDLFARSGFVGRRVDCESSMFGRLYVFERSRS